MNKLIQILIRQQAFSLRAFGPDYSYQQAIDHIRKELAEIEADPTDVKEPIDVVLIGLDMALRCERKKHSTEEAAVYAVTKALIDKIGVNENRSWPDWRTADPGKAIEHCK